MAQIRTLATDVLDIGYLDSGEGDLPVALLLHGWPDDAHGMSPIAERLQARGFRTIVPWLRSFGPTRFREAETMRDGRAVAMAQDAIDLLDGLGVEGCLVVGHDWGARIGYALAALVPQRLQALVALGFGYSPNGKFKTPDFKQSRLWWYQWFMTTDGGAEKVRQDPVGFARIQWKTWSPEGWFTDGDFDRTAESFHNPDWPAITLHDYRSRWTEEPVDPRYAGLQAKIEATAAVEVPTMMIVGQEDRADYPEESAGREAFFPAGYARHVLEGVGHFPAREAPDEIGRLIADFLSDYSECST